MKWILPVLIVLQVGFSKAYQGPLGLSWGMSSEKVDSVLSGRFELEEDIDSGDFGVTKEAIYIGTFADYPNSRLAANYFEGGLLGVTIIIPQQGNFPISKTWKESVNSFGERHGKANKMTKIPSTPGKATKEAMKKYPNTKNKQAISDLFEALSFTISDEEFLDIQIRKGAWSPLATWEFSNSTAYITTSIVMQNAEESGIEDLSTVWGFFDKKRMAVWEKKIAEEKKKRPSDF